MASKKIKGLNVLVEGDATGLSKAIRMATSEMNSMKSAVNNVNKALKLDPTNVELLESKQKLLRKAIDETSESLDELKDYQKQLDSQGDEIKLTKGYTELQKKIAETESTLKGFKNQLSSLPAEIQALEARLDSLGNSFDKISQKTAALSAASTAALVASAKSAMSYESEVAEIRKVVSDLSEETIEDLKAVAKQTATTTQAFSEISEYATIASTLGVAEDHLSSFAKTMKDLSVVTNEGISGEEGAKQVSRYLNVFGIGAEYASNLGSAISYVGDQFAATADEILEMASRMSGLSVIESITQNSLIGLAAELKNIGVETESGASAMTKAILSIENHVETGSKKLGIFAETAGMTSKEFKKAWSEDTIGTFLKFTDGLKSQVFVEIGNEVEKSSKKVKEFADVLGMSSEQFEQAWKQDSRKIFDEYVTALGELSEESTSASVVLSKVGLSGVRVSQALLKLAGNGETVEKAISDANAAWEENTALMKKSSAVYDTTESNIASTFEALKQSGDKIGKTFLPVINDAVDEIGELADKFSEADPKVAKLTAGMLAVGAAASPTAKVLSGTTKTISSLIKGYDKLKTSMGETEGPLSKILKSSSSLLPVLSGTGIAIGAVIAAMAGFYQYAKQNQSANMDLADSYREQRNALEELNQTAMQSYSYSLAEIETGNQYALTIDTIIGKLKTEQLTEEESISLKESLNEQIENLNTVIGYSAYAYDEESVNLMYLDTKVEDVTASYQALHEELKKTAWIDANREAYQTALQTLQESKDAMSKIVQNFFDSESQVSKEASELFQEYFIDKTISQEEYLQKLMDMSNVYPDLANEMTILASGYSNMNIALQEQQLLFQDATDFVSDYNSVMNSTAEDASILIDTLNAGIDLNSSFEELKEMETQLMNQIAIAEQWKNSGIITEEVVQAYRDDLYLVQEQMAGTVAAMQENNELGLYETSKSISEIANTLMQEVVDTTFDGSQQSLEEISAAIAEMYGIQIPPAMIDPTKSALENICKYWDAMKLSTKEVTVRVNYVTSGSVPTGATAVNSSYSSTSSAGNNRRSVSELDLMPSAYSMRSAAAPAMASLDEPIESNAAAEQIANNLTAMAATLSNNDDAQSMVTNNQTNNITIEFNVTNSGKQLTSSEIHSYADEIVKVVNDKIGRMIE